MFRHGFRQASMVGKKLFNYGSNVQEIGLVGPLAYTSRVVAGFGASLKEGVRRDFGRCLSVGALGDFT